MKYIKLFESFDKDYIIKSIKDIFVELQDDNMSVDVIDRRDFNDEITIKITSRNIEKVFDIPNVTNFTYEGNKEFNGDKLYEYIEMLKDFLESSSIKFNYHFELFDDDGVCINKNTNELGDFDKLGLVIIHLTDIKN